MVSDSCNITVIEKVLSLTMICDWKLIVYSFQKPVRVIILDIKEQEKKANEKLLFDL